VNAEINRYSINLLTTFYRNTQPNQYSTKPHNNSTKSWTSTVTSTGLHAGGALLLAASPVIS